MGKASRLIEIPFHSHHHIRIGRDRQAADSKARYEIYPPLVDYLAEPAFQRLVSIAQRLQELSFKRSCLAWRRCFCTMGKGNRPLDEQNSGSVSNPQRGVQ
ncbi:hypothetical protein Trco_006748 [Trichoderma cornu-damae]|uniref:Uncharacterized protein n=1 Tax=Trichoderma cornu-damae TaxID=654480 RepID=A0A9P8QHB4_9HYPO|nr:hypothetical protein Trco_006748 [Trichoderma cornu-damae]